MKDRNGQPLKVEADLGKVLFRLGKSEHIFPHRRGQNHWREINCAKEHEQRTDGAKGSRGQKGWK